MFKVRIRGVNNVVRQIVKAEESLYGAARAGCNAAAKHLADKVREKFDTGGNGSWPALQPDTIRKKGSSTILVETGAARGSITVVEGGKGRLAASVGIGPGYIVHHVYGAPGANIPVRDPILVTAKEEKATCTAIIMNYIKNAMG